MVFINFHQRRKEFDYLLSIREGFYAIGEGFPLRNLREGSKNREGLEKVSVPAV